MKSNWLISPTKDLGLLFLPVWLTWIVCFALPGSVLETDIPLWVWVVTVLAIDVGHVWSTIFRTYLSKEEFSNHKSVLLSTPPLAFAVFFILAFISVKLFWTVLAYLAVYHFIKQQYGFMKIYKARSGDFYKKKINDSLVIYISMLFPVFYWHINIDRTFTWFVEGDFINLQIPATVLSYINTVGIILYFSLMIAWLAEEIFLAAQKMKSFATGKVLWIITTTFNWYLGIVFFNSDLAFTITNVVAHGVPYFVLIFLYLDRKEKRVYKVKRSTLGTAVIFAGMVAVVLILAFGEEYFWDMLLYRDNPGFFQQVMSYPMEMVNSKVATAIALSLLSLPQVTHYVLDGYIWKVNHHNPHLKEAVIKV